VPTAIDAAWCALALLAANRHAAFLVTEPRWRGDAAMRSISSACAARPPRDHDRRKLLLNGARPASTTGLAATRVTIFLTASIVGAGAALRLRQPL